jgi:hypothetical protein
MSNKLTGYHPTKQGSRWIVTDGGHHCSITVDWSNPTAPPFKTRKSAVEFILKEKLPTNDVYLKIGCSLCGEPGSLPPKPKDVTLRQIINRWAQAPLRGVRS